MHGTHIGEHHIWSMLSWNLPSCYGRAAVFTKVVMEVMEVIIIGLQMNLIIWQTNQNFVGKIWAKLYFCLHKLHAYPTFLVWGCNPLHGSDNTPIP